MLKKTKTEKYILVLFLAFMVFYYAFRMITISPWYDEVYTYNSFISRGPVYSALHWPFPNNHVFFSVISSLLNPFGNLIALRGISFLSAVGTIFLLVHFLKKENNTLAVITSICFYNFLILPVTLSVQGRGYSLATFFLVLALVSGKSIFVDEKPGKKWYILWFISLWLGLYTLVSSVYYVSAVCLFFGIYALIVKKYKELIKLIIASFCSAVATFVCYGILWLSIGSHDIYLYDGVSDSHVRIVLSMPFECLKRGIYLMKSNPFMGGVERKLFVQDFRYFFSQLFGEFFGITNNRINIVFFAVILIYLLVISVYAIFRVKKGEKVSGVWELFYGLAAGLSMITVFVVLLIQSTYPFARNLSFLGIFFTIFIYVPVNKLFELIGKKGLLSVITLIVMICSAVVMLSGYRMRQYSEIDHHAADAISQCSFENGTTYMVSDEYSQQQMEYIVLKGRKADLTITDDPTCTDYVIVMKGDNTGEWPYIHNGDEIATATSGKTLIAENAYYEIWK